MGLGRQAAEAFFSAALLDSVAELYGVRPHVEWVQVAALVENAAVQLAR